MKLNVLISLLFLSLLYACDSTDEPKIIVDMEIDQEIDMLQPDMGTMLSSRCPDLTTGSYFLVLYADRVEAFQRDERGFKVSRNCTFLALYEQGITNASAFVRLNDGRFVIAQPGEQGGFIYTYDPKGTFERKDDANINLKNIQGLWLKYDGKIVAWNQANENLYLLDENATFVGSYKPPQSSNAKLSKLKDLIFVAPDDQGDRMVAIFEDAPPKLFAFPMPLSWDTSVIASAKSIAGIPSQIGIKLLISGDINGNGGGIALYRPIQSGRALPEPEKIDLVYPSDPGYGDGFELVAVEEGIFFVLDQGSLGNDGTQSLNSFNSFGIPQEQNALPNVENSKALDVIYTTLNLD